jgi:hypothetical protein
MAIDYGTELGDLFIPEVYLDYEAEMNFEKSALFRAGAATRNARLDALVSNGQGGDIISLPHFKPLDHSVEPNYPTDDPGDAISPLAVTAGMQKARVVEHNQAFSSADLVASMIGDDPLQHVRNEFGNYWAGVLQRRVLSTLIGVKNDDAENHDDSLTVDIGAATNALLDSGGDIHKISKEAILRAMFTAGDSFNNYNMIAMHSTVYQRILNQDKVEQEKDANGRVIIERYLGKVVVVDDLLPTTAAAGSGDEDAPATYTTILLGSNAIAYGVGSVANPAYVKREEMLANGGGVEIIGERQKFILHPAGYQWTETTVTPDFFPNRANLQAHANWTRVYNRKNIPIAFLVTNG